LLDHLEVALECGYVSPEEHAILNQSGEQLLALLNGYVKFLKAKKDM